MNRENRYIPIVYSILGLILLYTFCSCEKEGFKPLAVVITIDDAPNLPENTSAILDVLKEYNVQATFFCIGQYLDESPELAKRMAREQTIANHTYNHYDLQTVSMDVFQQELYKNQVLVDAINTGQDKPTNTLFRFPYGSFTKKEIKYLLDYGFTIVWWDYDASDWDPNVTPEQILQHHINCLKGNNKETPILLFHTQNNSVKGLKLVLEYLKINNITVTTLDKIL